MGMTFSSQVSLAYHQLNFCDRCQRQWLYWYDSEGARFSTPDEVAQQEQQRTQRLAERLREMGIDPEQL
jgi:hypothetical protein